MKSLIGLILVAAIGYGYYTNPGFDAHRQAIAEVCQLPEGDAGEEALAQLDYSNFFIASTVKDTVRLTLVSYGLLGRVKVVDPEWPETGQAAE